MMRPVLRIFLRNWVRDCAGLAAAEMALVFPILFVLFIGILELGNGILVNQKAIASSQMVADLITRVEVLTDEQLEEAIRAGQLALTPFDTANLGFDIVSFQFDADSQPVISWRETRNMDTIDDVEERVESLAMPGEGVVFVAVRYPYEPPFGRTVIDDINMVEIAFARGRKSAVVLREN